MQDQMAKLPQWDLQVNKYNSTSLQFDIHVSKELSISEAYQFQEDAKETSRGKKITGC
jgi:hypothetical protein